MGARLTRPARSAWFAVCFVLAAVGSSSVVFRMAAELGPDEPKLMLDAIPQLAQKLDRLRSVAARSEPGTVHVAFLGDSMLIQNRKRDGIPAQVEREVNRHGAPHVAVHELAIPGSAAFDYYFVADEVGRAEPDLVVLEFNLTTLSETWRAAFARPQLAGLIPLRRIPEALTLPTHWTGLTADRLLTYAVLMRLGALSPWMQLASSQARVPYLTRRLVDWADDALGASAERRFRELRFLRDVRRDPGTNRFDGARETERFGSALRGVGRGHAVLRALSATVRDFRHAGVPVYVYVNPANVDNLERVGILDRASLAVTLEAIEQVVERAGGRHSDFHALLPDAAFKDPAGHFTLGVEPDGSAILARAVAEVVREEALRIVPRR